MVSYVHIQAGLPMTNLVDRLRAALDQHEQVAHAAANGDPHWVQSTWPTDRGHITTAGGGTVVYDEGCPSEEQATHIAANDPANVLRTIAAHRRIAERHAPQQVTGGHYECRTCSDGYGYHDPAPCADLRDIASIYLPDTDQGETQ